MNPDIRFYQQAAQAQMNAAAQAQMNAAQSQYLAQATIGTGGTANYNPYVWYDSSAGSGGSLIPCVAPPVTPASSPKNEKDWLRGRVDEILWRG